MMTSQCPINANEKLPWGWHFRPTPVELIHNLKKKVRRQRQERVQFESETGDMSDVLREIDLSQVEPWEIKGITETCSIRATHADELNQYFYTQKEQKYRHGKRSNRATKGGFWKATGRDKPIFGKVNPRDKYKKIIGYRKALVFYEGRAPNGNKTDWILHEYRLESLGDTAAKDEQWVACHMFIKERNIQPREPADVVDLGVDLQKKQYNEWVDVPHHQQGMNVKPEPGYSQSYPYVAPGSHPPCEGDEMSLPRLEDESTYSVHRPCPSSDMQAGQFPRVTTVRLPSSYDHQLSRPTIGGRMLSFDQLPRPATGGRMPPFDQLSRPSAGGRMPPFDQHQVQVHRQVAQGRPGSFEDRHLQDILSDIFSEPLQQSETTFESLWC
ncbi:unnamed protein product [Calypogeia fissa]